MPLPEANSNVLRRKDEGGDMMDFTQGCVFGLIAGILFTVVVTLAGIKVASDILSDTGSPVIGTEEVVIPNPHLSPIHHEPNTNGF